MNVRSFRFWFFFGSIIVFAIILQSFILLRYRDIFWGRGDPAVYYEIADSIVKNKGPVVGYSLAGSSPHDIWAPGVSYLIAGSFLILGQSIISAKLVGFIFGIALVVLIIYLGIYLFNARIGLLAGFFLAILPARIFFSAVIAKDVPYAFWALFSIMFLLKGVQNKKISFYFASGIFLALACLTRYMGWSVVLGYLFFFICLRRKKQIDLSYIIALLIPAIIIQLPWYIYYFRFYQLSDFPFFKGGGDVTGLSSEVLWFVAKQKIKWIYHIVWDAPAVISMPLLLCSLLGLVKAKNNYALLIKCIVIVHLLGIVLLVHNKTLPKTFFLDASMLIPLAAWGIYFIRDNLSAGLKKYVIPLFMIWVTYSFIGGYLKETAISNIGGLHSSFWQNDWKATERAGNWIRKNLNPESKMMARHPHELHYFSGINLGYIPSYDSRSVLIKEISGKKVSYLLLKRENDYKLVELLNLAPEDLVYRDRDNNYSIYRLFPYRWE